MDLAAVLTNDVRQLEEEESCADGQGKCKTLCNTPPRHFEAVEESKQCKEIEEHGSTFNGRCCVPEAKRCPETYAQGVSTLIKDCNGDMVKVPDKFTQRSGHWCCKKKRIIDTRTKYRISFTARVTTMDKTEWEHPFEHKDTTRTIEIVPGDTLLGNQYTKMTINPEVGGVPQTVVADNLVIGAQLSVSIVTSYLKSFSPETLRQKVEIAKREILELYKRRKDYPDKVGDDKLPTVLFTPVEKLRIDARDVTSEPVK